MDKQELEELVQYLIDSPDTLDGMIALRVMFIERTDIIQALKTSWYCKYLRLKTKYDLAMTEDVLELMKVDDSMTNAKATKLSKVTHKELQLELLEANIVQEKLKDLFFYYKAEGKIL